MKTRFAKLLSIVLALMMLFSVLPTAVLAKTVDDNGATVLSSWFDRWWDFFFPRPKPQPAYPPQTLSYDSQSGTHVYVDAPQGALPANTSLDVVDIADMNLVQNAFDATADEDGNVLSALDISFLDPQREEVHPNAPVTVILDVPAIMNATNLYLVHFKCGASELTGDVEMEYVDDCIINGSSVTFEAQDFSVYAIIGEDETDPATYSIKYEFYTDDTFGTPYTFINSEGAETYYQYVGEGETLINPGTPAVEDTTDGRQFTGWIAEGDTVPTIPAGVNGVTMEDTISANETIRLYPCYQKPYYIIYLDENGLNYRIETTYNSDFTVTNNRASLMDDDDPTEYRMSYQPNEANEAFIGWAVESAPTQAVQEVTFAEGVNTVTLVPVDIQVVWVYFDKNDDDGGGTYAIYTAPHYLESGETMRQRYSSKYDATTNYLPAPTRMGYTFGGWFFENGTQFTADTVVTADISVKARWLPDTVQYSIVYWAQYASDEVDLPDELPEDAPEGAKAKSYYYLASETGTAQTGSPVSLTTADKNAKLETGFVLNENLTDSVVKTVKPDNSTVLNVYYDREVHTLTFQVNSAGYQYVVNNNQTTGNIYGLMADGSFVLLSHRSTAGTAEITVYEIVTSLAANEEYLLALGNYVLSTTQSSSGNCPRFAPATFTSSGSYYLAELNGTTYGSDIEAFLLTSAATNESDCYTLYNNSISSYLDNSGSYPKFGSSATSWYWAQGNALAAVENTSQFYYMYRDGSGTTNSPYYLNSTNSTNSLSTTNAGFTFYRKTTQTIDTSVNTWYYTDDQGEHVYTGDRYVYQYSSSGYRTVFAYRALYGHSLNDKDHPIFPIQGYDGTDCTGYRWSCTDSSIYEYVLMTVDIMPAADAVFRGRYSGSYKTILYYTEVYPGEDLEGIETVEFTCSDGVTRTYELYKTVLHNFNFLTYKEEYHDLVGFNTDRNNAEPAFGQPQYRPGNFYYYTSITDWNLQTSPDQNQAPIPNYAYAYNSNTETTYMYHHNNGRNFTYLSTDAEKEQYAEEWVNKLYYNRKSFDLEFYDGYDNTPIGGANSPLKVSFAYEQQLTSASSLFTVSADKSSITDGTHTLSHVGSTFKGWFADPACQVPFDFSQPMPEHPVKVYAGWSSLRFRVWVQPNGGVFGHYTDTVLDEETGEEVTGERFTESTYFRTNYNTIVARYDDVETIGRNYYQDDENGTYAYIYICDPLITDSEGNRISGWDSARCAYYKPISELSHEAVIINEQGAYDVVDEYEYWDGHKYVQQNGVYSFVGWFEVTSANLSNDNVMPPIRESDTLEPFDFGTPIDEKHCIRAMWKRIGRFAIAYDGNMYDDDGNVVVENELEAPAIPPTTEFDFCDLANAITEYAPKSVPANYVFIGWKTPAGEIKQPWEVLTVYSNLAEKTPTSSAEDPQYVYTLTAVYQQLPTTSLKYDINVPEGHSAASATLADGHVGYVVDADGNDAGEGYYTIAANGLENVLINSSVLLSDGEGFKVNGYRLIGWNDVKADANNGIVKFELGGIYGVGDDEVGNGNTLYAVWGNPVFYIYHSGTKTVERVTDHKGGTVYELAKKTAANFLYGGYYKNYTGKTAGLSVEMLEALEESAWDANKYIDATGTAYTGKPGAWIAEDAYTDVDGLHLIPVDGMIYYLKEVPAAKYLRPFVYYTYYTISETEANPISTIWIISDVDDLNYPEAGFVITVTDTSKNEETEQFVKSLKITPHNNPDGSVTLNSTKCFNARGYLTYLTVYNDGEYGDPVTPNMLDGNAKIAQYWVTPDGCIVTGTATRIYSNVFTTDISAVTNNVASEIAVFNPDSGD